MSAEREATAPASARTQRVGGAPAADAAAQRDAVEPCWGNQAMQRRLQAKLRIGSTSDPLEAEADRIADQVVSTPSHPAVSDAPLRIQRHAGSAGGQGGEVPASVERVLSGTGNPLGATLRQDMEQRFGHDFSQVRVHCGSEAEQSALDVNAQAYTVGQHVVFGAGRFDPGTSAGRHLLAHELAHVVQQSQGGGVPGPQPQGMLRRRYRLNEVQAGSAAGHQVGGSPRTLFYAGSAANAANRKALVVAGIHGTEASAIALGAEVESELSSGTLVPDFHTLFVPRVNPTRGRGTSHVPDLNREYGGTVASAEPIAGEIQAMVTEFEPERILTIHAVSRPALSGLFLDPIRSTGSAPGPLNTPALREAAFTGDARNRAAMTLTDSLITAVRAPGAAGLAATPGNSAGNLPLASGSASFPASRYPGAAGGASPYSLVYPQQNQVAPGPHGETSLGVWASQLSFGPAVITLEVPGYAIGAGGANWRPFLPAVREFLRMPAAAAPTPAPGGPVAPAPTGVPAPSASGSVLRRTPLTEANLRPQRRVPFSFVQEVYRRQVAIWTARGASYTHEVPGGDLVSLASADVITGRTVSVHHDIASSVHRLLTHARTDLAAAGSAGAGVTDLAVRSGYRSAPSQFSIWEREFPHYYRDTRTARAALPGGEHGSAAAQHLAEYINGRVFSPGYSPHQRGKTIDFSYRSATEWPSADRNWAEADSSAAGLATWTGSWFYGWLRAHASTYGFAENPAIHEPWHWEWSAPVSVFQRIWRLLLRLWRFILRMLGQDLPPDGEDGDGPQAPPDARSEESSGEAPR